MSGLCETFGVGLMEVPVKDIIPNPHQPRKRFREKDIERLSDSIRRVGVINPISVRYENGRRKTRGPIFNSVSACDRR